jgi:hypothetical protein
MSAPQQARPGTSRRRFLCFLILLLVLGLGAWAGLLWYAEATRSDNYSQIEEGLYQGGFVEKPPWGTKAVLNLCEVEDPYRTPHYLWEATRDAAPAPGLDWLRRMVAYVEEHRQAGRKVYVHCRNGVSRSGLVVVAYEMHKNRWTRDEALAFVRTRRPETRPNQAFMELLLEWEREVKEPK